MHLVEIKTTSGVYTIHTFTSPGNFVVTSGGEVEYLIVGGGGGGGSGDAPPDADAEGGGGGAGAVYSTDPAIPSPQRKSPITVTIARLIQSLLEVVVRVPLVKIMVSMRGQMGVLVVLSV